MGKPKPCKHGLHCVFAVGETRGSETSQYLEEKKTTPCVNTRHIPLVAASEQGRAQTKHIFYVFGVVGQQQGFTREVKKIVG